MTTTKRAKSTNAVAKSELFSSNDVPGMISLLEKKLENFKGINESNYRTSGHIEGIGDIKTMEDTKGLLSAMGSILTSEKAYNEGAKALGLKTYPAYSYKGSPLEDWKSDIKLRYDLITQKETIDTLNEFKRQLESFMSEEDKKAALLNRMQDYFQEK
jgi:hypothetical protein